MIKTIFQMDSNNDIRIVRVTNDTILIILGQLESIIVRAGTTGGVTPPPPKKKGPNLPRGAPWNAEISNCNAWDWTRKSFKIYFSRLWRHSTEQ